MMDNIRITLEAGPEIKAALAKHRDYVMKETLALELAEGEGLEAFDLNGHQTGIRVEKLQ
jgi:isoleucyl-tRNA synthetase